MTDPTQALSFGTAAADYDRYRPRYPQAALRWALDGIDAPARLVDLAAGTGILARGLLALGHRVTAVEPDPGMRTHLTSVGSDVRALAGSAEAMPLPAGSPTPSSPARRTTGSTGHGHTRRSPGYCAPAGSSRRCGTCGTTRAAGWSS